jgi:hypothetical protein
VRAVDADRPSDSDLPFTRQASGFVNMAMEREKRLPVFDEPPHGNAADVEIQINMLIRLAIEGSAIQCRVVGWCMKQKDGSIERFVAN